MNHPEGKPFIDCLIDGRRGDALPPTNRGLHYGDGVFRTTLIHGGHVHDLEGQLAHLENDCKRLAIRCPVDEIRQEAEDLASALGSGVLKIIVTRGGGARGYAASEQAGARLLLTYTVSEMPQEYWQAGIELRLCSTRLGINPRLAGVKHLNRLEQVLARSEWRGPDPQEGVMLDTQDHVIAGTMSNLFWVGAGRLHTPALDRCGVSGRMRACILGAAKHCGIETIEDDFSLEDCIQAEEIFISNSVIGLWPVKWFMDNDYLSGPVIRQLLQALDSHPRLTQH